MVVSYNKLIDFIDAFASAHIQVQRFQAEFEDQMPNFATTGEAFPVLFMAPVQTLFGENIDTFTVNIYCYGRIQKDRSDVNKVFSDTQLILNDLKKYILNGDNTAFDIMDDANAYPMREITMDYVIGNMMTIDIEVGTYSECEIPFSDAPVFPINSCDNVYPTYLNCNTLGDCSTFTTAIDGLQAEINALSGATDEYWTIELMDAQTVDFYAPYNLAINSYDTILSASTVTFLDDGLTYTLGDPIVSGSKITVSAATPTVINLNTVR